MQIVTPGGCGAHEEGEFYDTISADGDCTVRFRTADIGQRCVLHCHVLFHEDSGSMSWVNVTGPNMPMNTVQSPEYVCPAGTLPSVAPAVPTAPPTQAPSFPNSCVPGYLGVAYGQPPLLDDETFVNEEFGTYSNSITHVYHASSLVCTHSLFSHLLQASTSFSKATVI
jgi:hypothetical protein